MKWRQYDSNGRKENSITHRYGEMFHFLPSVTSGCDYIKLQLCILPFKLEHVESTFKPSSLSKKKHIIYTYSSLLQKKI